ncbi:MAG TPA: 4-hydroxybenzoate octaprenyltransferase [Sphingomicrobium sp.]|nr:4-hydroxybenzoate octaprenyltransferase [Sphingomicrobium sp.]
MTPTTQPASHLVPDSERRGLIGALPPSLRPFASLMRIDRPIGTWLLFWPCAWSVALGNGWSGSWDLLLWFALGAFAMRSAGCVFNDIVDRKLDARVERTRARPLASGRVSLAAAWALLAGLCLIGLLVLLQLTPFAQLVALASIPLVAIYPFMKRITWWPQLWLGLVFSWGALVGWASNPLWPMVPDTRALIGGLGIGVMLYAGTLFWVIGYDTLYAIQDVEDDALIGIKSSARRLGDRAASGVGLFYATAILTWGAVLWSFRPHWLSLLALLPAALHLARQAIRADPADGQAALVLFRSNRTCGLLVFLAMLVVGSATR